LHRQAISKQSQRVKLSTSENGGAQRARAASSLEYLQDAIDALGRRIRAGGRNATRQKMTKLVFTQMRSAAVQNGSDRREQITEHRGTSSNAGSARCSKKSCSPLQRHHQTQRKSQALGMKLSHSEIRDQRSNERIPGVLTAWQPKQIPRDSVLCSLKFSSDNLNTQP
jgi:transglutaminase/protease-like cytokinesis protein 3